MSENKIQTVDEYINQFEDDVKNKLITIRNIIQTNAPLATEKLSWGMPAYYQNGFLVQFAAHKKHIGFYCNPSTIAHFKEELAGFKTNTKNTIQFPLNKELPLELIKKLVLFRIDENMNKSK